jgi:hypothetical protein
MLIMLSVLCQDFSNVSWDAAVVHFEVSDVTPESRKELKAGLEDLHQKVKGFRADIAIGKDGVIVTDASRITNIQKYDVIKAVDGSPVTSVADLQAIVEKMEPGVFAKFDILRPTLKGSRAPFTKVQVDYAPTSEYLLTLAPFDKREIKATRQVLYVPRDAETRRAMYFQLLVGPNQRLAKPQEDMVVEVVFNLVVSLYTSNADLSTATLITETKTARARMETHEMSNYSAIPGERFRYWIQRDASRRDLAGFMDIVKGNEDITLQLSSTTRIEVDVDITQSIRDNLRAIEKLKAAIAHKQRTQK